MAAVVLAAFAASGAMISLMQGFDATYQISAKRILYAGTRRGAPAGVHHRGPLVGRVRR